MKIFVFGSNLAGRHGAGSAKEAVRNHGAKWGIGVGLQGRSYAIPTKDRSLAPLPLTDIKTYVEQFKEFATNHPLLRFEVVKVGCGLAGYAESDIMTMFEDCPENCDLPEGWRNLEIHDE